MRKLLFVTIASLSCFALQAFDFARDGKALCTIAVPENMSNLEIMAKDDLAYFLNKITGATFQIVPETQAKSPAIYVGFTRFAKNKGIDVAKLGKEEWVIRTVDDDLILTGGGRVGPFYAVTVLLRKLGCYTLTMDQEIYPHQPTLSLPNPDEQGEPVFQGRSIYDSLGARAYHDQITYDDARARNMYLLRNFRNGCGQAARNLDPYYIGDLYNINQFPEFHSLVLFVPPEKYFASHPEYYAMDQEGQRVRPRDLTIGSCLCMSNPEVADVVIENMLAMIQKDRSTVPEERYTRLYDLSLLDNFPYLCQCPKCKAIIEQAGGKEKGGTTALMLMFSNKVAKALAEKYPDITLRIFAYSCCRQPPAIPLKIEKNILIQYCDLFASGDSYRPLTSKFNKQAYSQLQGWHKSGAGLMVWDYWNLPGQNPRPETVIDTLQPDLQLFEKLGVKCLFLEAEMQLFCPQNFMDMQYFVGAQLMENPHHDVEKLIDIYCKGYYGPAAPVMKNYLNVLRKGVKEHPSKQISISINRWNYLTSAFAIDWYQRITAAEKALPERSPYRARVRAEKLSLLWNVCMYGSMFKKDFAKIGLTMEDLQKECYDGSIAFMHRHPYKNISRHDHKLNKLWEMITLKLPVPDFLKQVPEEHVKMFGYPDYRKVDGYRADTAKDPEASCGKAFKSAHPRLSHHGPGKMYKEGAHRYCATRFYLSNIGLTGPGNKVELTLHKVPQDEKYHWYRFPKPFNMNTLAYFWGHGWGIQVDISRAYIVADGVSDTNLWDGWFRVKFTGPAYVPGSKKENAIWYDYLILTRPGQKSLEKLPQSGLIK